MIITLQAQGVGKRSRRRTGAQAELALLLGHPPSEPRLSPAAVYMAEQNECGPGAQRGGAKAGSAQWFCALWQLTEPLWDYLSLKWRFKCKCSALTGAVGRISRHDVHETLSPALGTCKRLMNGSHCAGEKEEKEEEEKRKTRTPITCSGLPLFLTSPLCSGEPICHSSHGQEEPSHPQSPGRDFPP